MNIITTFNLLLELAIQYLRLKIKTSTFDILDKFDSRLDKMTKEQERLRKSPNSLEQDLAEKLFDEIMEEQKKKKLFLADQKLTIDGANKNDTLKSWIVKSALTRLWNQSLVHTAKVAGITSFTQHTTTLKAFLQIIPMTWLGTDGL